MAVYATSERTKQALIDAAGELAAERGVGRVSTRAVADRAGENLGTIHYHFGSKEGLLKEMLRFACRVKTGPTLAEVIESCHQHLDEPQSRPRAIRKLVGYLVDAIFSPDRPRWCARVLYQVAQHEGPLRDFLRKQLLDPHFEAITAMVQRVRPDWSVHQIYLWTYMLVGPAVYHADHCEVILDRLGSKTFPEEYLAGLERRIADDAIRALGLQTDAN